MLYALTLTQYSEVVREYKPKQKLVGITLVIHDRTVRRITDEPTVTTNG
jgi:hypothetical protein